MNSNEAKYSLGCELLYLQDLAVAVVKQAIEEDPNHILKEPDPSTVDKILSDVALERIRINLEKEI